MAESNINVEDFREWAACIGCPTDEIPSEEALKSVFKSRQRDVFATLINRLRPRQEVEAKRQQILIRKIKNINGRPVPTCRAALPQSLQTYFKVKDLKARRADVLERINDRKQQYEGLLSAFTTKNIQVLCAENRNNLLKENSAILALRAKSLDKHIKKEKDLKAQLLANMPVQLTPQNASEQTTIDTVQKVLAELESFDTWANNNKNSTALANAKEQLWPELRMLLSNLPNFLLFNCIMSLKDKHLEYLKGLNKTEISDSHTHSLIVKEPMSDFEKKLMKLKIDAISLNVQLKKATEEREKIEDVFCQHFALLTNKIRKKVSASNPHESDENIDEILSEYMIQRNFHVSLKAKNEGLLKQIDDNQSEKIQLAQKLEMQELLLGNVKQAYAESNTTINQIQDKIEQLCTMKKKISYSANVLKTKHQEFKMSQSSYASLHATKQNSLTVPSHTPNTTGDSFEISGMIGEGKFSSTLLDFETSDRSFMSMDCTDTANFGHDIRNNVPPYLMELRSFTSMSLRNLSKINKKLAFKIGFNPLVTESQTPSTVLQLVLGGILTPRAALKEIRQNVSLAGLITQHSINLELNFDMSTVDLASCKQHKISQYDVMDQLLDKFDFNGKRVKRSLERSWNILYFIIQNPLRHYIPSSVVYNKRTYPEYEVEYKTYMKIANS